MDEIKKQVFNKFFKTVVDMRQAQKDYFARRTNDNLTRSKQLERSVDEQVKAISNGSAFNVQEELGI